MDLDQKRTIVAGLMFLLEGDEEAFQDLLDLSNERRLLEEVFRVFADYFVEVAARVGPTGDRAELAQRLRERNLGWEGSR